MICPSTAGALSGDAMDSRRAPGCAIEAACELAHTMTQRAAPGDRHRASELLARAVRDAESLGMDLLVDRARAIATKMDN